MPRVSVIITTYNRADLIGEAIKSVLDQTYTDWELIVVDDGSTDETAQMVAQFGEKVTYIYQENAGACVARNVGFAASQGEFVSFLDSDDRMLPHNLESLVVLLDDQPEVSIAYGWYYWMDEYGQPVLVAHPKIEGYSFQDISPWPDITLVPSGTTLEGQIFSGLVLEETMLIGSVLIRRDCVAAIGGFNPDVQFQEHWDFFLRLAASGYTFACCKQPVVLLRLHSKNRSQRIDAMLASRLAILNRLFNDITIETTPESVRRQAYHNTYFVYAVIHYAHGDFEKGAAYLNKALHYAQLNSNDLARISEAIANYILKSDTEDPLRFSHNFFRLIESKPLKLRLRRKVQSIIHVELAFRHYRAKRFNQVWRQVLGAVIHDPPLWFNRGLIRIAIEGVVGSRLFNSMRRQPEGRS